MLKSRSSLSYCSTRDLEVLSFPSLLENGYEVVDTATMAISQRLLACLNNERMTDIYLVGEDDVKIAASKYILGSLSPPLQFLLFNGTDGSTVSIENCRSKALQALVEFSCSDMLNTNIWADTEPVEIVEDMVSLAKLAEIYALPNLKQQVSDVLSPCLDQLPSLACVAYNLVDTTTTVELYEASLNVLRKKAHMAFAKGPGGEIGGVSCLSPDKLDIVFADNLVNAKEIFLFQCLLEWRDDNFDTYPDASEIATRVAQHLDFSAMDASDIEDIVLPSGIVDSASLVTGLMTVAKAAQKKGISLRSARRKAAKASGSSDVTCATTSVPKSTPGRNSRRFKKSPADASSVSSSDDTRDVPEEVKTKLPSFFSPSKASRAIKSPKGGSMKSRASKILGSMRNLRPVKENSTERETDRPDNSHPPSTLFNREGLSEVSFSMSASGSNDAEEQHAKPARHHKSAMTAE